MDNPKEKVYWRGAPNTFNAGLYRQKLEAMAGHNAQLAGIPFWDARMGSASSTDTDAAGASRRTSGTLAPPTVEFPAFDHATADPEEGAVVFDRGKHSIVIVEGIYTLLNDNEWAGLASTFNFRIFVDSDLEKCTSSFPVISFPIICFPVIRFRPPEDVIGPQVLPLEGGSPCLKVAALA